MRIVIDAAVGCLALALTASASASALTDSKRLICAMDESASCTRGGQCVTGGPDLINLPVFLHIDLDAKTITTGGAVQDPSASPISSVASNGSVLLLQGADEGRAWSASINRDTGELVATITGQNAGFAAFGHCTAP